MCITLPLKIKRIVTPKLTMVCVCSIFVVNMVSFFPEYATFYIGWKFYEERNRTLLGLVPNSKKMEGLGFFLFSVLGSASFVAVILFTAVLVFQLKRKSKWRGTANACKISSESISNRDRKTMNMVVMIAIVLIVCYVPGVVISMTSFFEPKFSILGEESNAFHVSWSFAFIFEALNSSVNIFVYYNMSTKFRETFQELICFSK